jgi:hypothetical protein
MNLLLVPGAPRFLEIVPKNPVALQIMWQKPEIASNCVKKYRVTIDTGSHDDRFLVTKYTNETLYIFKDLYACFSYFVSVTTIDRENGDTFLVVNQSLPTFPAGKVYYYYYCCFKRKTY